MATCSWHCEHEHADLIPHIAPLEREAQRYASIRTQECLMLATTPESWFALIRGEPGQVDTTAAKRQNQRMGGR